MKYIFDFDDVLFHTEKKFKAHIYEILASRGVSREMVAEYLEKEKINLFSLKKVLENFSVGSSYEEIMSEVKNFTNFPLIDQIKKLGRENCYIITFGDEEFQGDKITRAGIKELFQEIIIVSGSKKEAVEKICEHHKSEDVIYFDDKARHFEGLDFKKYPNLKTILYNGQDVDMHSLASI